MLSKLKGIKLKSPITYTLLPFRLQSVVMWQVLLFRVGDFATDTGLQKFSTSNKLVVNTERMCILLGYFNRFI